MIEAYVNSAEQLELRIHTSQGQVASDDPVVVDVYRGSEKIVDGAPAASVQESIDGVPTPYYTYDLDPLLTVDQGTLKVVWRYSIWGSPMTRDEIVEVVTPYVYPDEVKREYPVLANRTYDQIKGIEATVRYVINAYCSQSFGLEKNKTVTVRGNNSGTLLLPQRLSKAASIQNGGMNVSRYLSVVHDGWGIVYPQYNGFVDVKADIGLEPSTRRLFRADSTFTITGDFGWDHVPAEVNKAARILVGKAMEPESEWRSYNVKVVTAADWRIEFATAPISTTGDINADLMLAKYKNPRMAII